AVSRLTLNGSNMVEPGGGSLILRGINEGTWGKMRSYDAATIASQGGKVVRVLIRWWGLYGGTNVESRSDANPGHFKPDHLAQFLQEIQWCIDAGLWVIPVIDSNCGQNGLQDPDMALYCDPDGAYPGGRNFWTDLTQRQLFKESWVYLAGILKNYSNIAFYELLPEPLAGRNSTYGADVSAFYQELMAAIEDATGDKRTPFLVGPRDAYNINLCDEAYIADPRWANRVVYTGNLFIRTNNSQAQNIANIESRLGALVNMKTSRNVPVFIQQFGVRTGDDPNEFYLDAGLSRMNAAGVGYTGWQWRQNTSSASEYAIVIEDANTGADIVKTDVLAVYSSYWKA
ncbi:MAG: glycoside hydrolase family 5 protein, partial [Burkholderiaceae bacterium]